jgi:hypothetical protein
MPRAPLFQSQLPHYEAKPVTLPRIALPDTDELDLKTKAARFLECRIIKDGQARWQEINRAGSFEAWKAIGAALLVGKTHALKITRANAAWGSAYSKEFNRWIAEHGFDRMPGPTRSVAITLAENAEAISTWRDSLPEKQRRRLINPQSVVRRWRATTQANEKHVSHLEPSSGKSPKDEALAAWHKFVYLCEALPADQAAPLKATAAEFLERDGAAEVAGRGQPMDGGVVSPGFR